MVDRDIQLLGTLKIYYNIAWQCISGITKYILWETAHKCREGNNGKIISEDNGIPFILVHIHFTPITCTCVAKKLSL
jgi:hypothetical protein